jgi:hypothetical protein
MLRASIVIGVVLTAVACSDAPPAALPVQEAAAATGTIAGRVRLTGAAPENPAIRMAADPVCARLAAGRRLVQEITVASAEGGLRDVFVSVEGSFPSTPAPAEPVMLDQQTCVYIPRMIGARVGQTLQVRNSDPTLHNVHGISTRGHDFNVGQPTAGIVSSFPLKDQEILHLKCDVHLWMDAFVGIVNHPYFAVSNDAGSFTIADVPAGRQTIHAWHEALGPLTETVDIRPGETTTVDFVYTGAEKAGPPRGLAFREVTIPGSFLTTEILAPRTP